MQLFKHLEDLIAMELLPRMDGYDNLPEDEVPGTEVKKIMDQYQYIPMINKLVGSVVYQGVRWYVVDPKVKDLAEAIASFKVKQPELAPLTERCDRCGAHAVVEVLTTSLHALYLCGHHAKAANLDANEQVLSHIEHKMEGRD